MARGTYQKLRELLPVEAISSKKIYAALCCHTRSPGYLRLLKVNTHRLMPGGKQKGKVTAEDAAFARKKLEACQKSRPRHQKVLVTSTS